MESEKEKGARGKGTGNGGNEDCRTGAQERAEKTRIKKKEVDEMTEWNEPDYTDEEKEEFLEEKLLRDENRKKRDERARKTGLLRRRIAVTAAFAAVFGLVFGGTFSAVKTISEHMEASRNAEAEKTALIAPAESGSGFFGNQDEEERNEGTRPLLPGITDGTEDGEAVTGETADAGEDSAEDGITLAESGIEETEADLSTTKTGAEGTLSVADVAENAMPAMVSITNTSVETVRDFFSGRQKTYESVGAGTGIIIAQTDTELLIATNAHVVKDAREISVSFIDEETAEGTLVGYDEDNDLAVVAVDTAGLGEETANAIRVMTIGDSDAARVGEQVVAIGNALGYGQSVSAGYLSAKDRGLENGASVGLLQTDAAINPGNSGGALLNMQGQLIGINSSKYADTSVEGMGFAIPISYAKPILESMMNDESGESGQGRDVTVGEDSAYLGIRCYSVSEEAATYYATPVGVLVQDVYAGSPAENAGLRQADIITGVDDFKIEDQETLVKVLTYYKAGDSAVITYARSDENGGYKTYTTNVVFASRAAA